MSSQNTMEIPQEKWVEELEGLLSVNVMSYSGGCTVDPEKLLEFVIKQRADSYKDGQRDRDRELREKVKGLETEGFHKRGARLKRISKQQVLDLLADKTVNKFDQAAKSKDRADLLYYKARDDFFLKRFEADDKTEELIVDGHKVVKGDGFSMRWDDGQPHGIYEVKNDKTEGHE